VQLRYHRYLPNGDPHSSSSLVKDALKSLEVRKYVKVNDRSCTNVNVWRGRNKLSRISVSRLSVLRYGLVCTHTRMLLNVQHDRFNE
jgi:hypothetical protein